MTEKPWIRSIANTCGELEQEAKSRKYNVIEAFAVMTFCLVVLWVLQYPLGVLLKVDGVMPLTSILLFFGAVYLLFVSPFIHKDTLSQWGLGNPMALVRLIREGPVIKRVAICAVVGALTAFLTAMAYVQWHEVADFLFNMKRETALAIKGSLGGKILIVLLGFVMASFLSTCVIRYDNFLSAFFTALKIVIVLGSLLYLAALGTIGLDAFSDFHPSKFTLDIFGYVFWGAIQQLLFCSYFGTRIRKGFAPAKDPARRWRKRFWVAVLNGLFFGLIHINSWYLVFGTWILGTILSWVFMEDKNRNLIALGFVHGFLGSSLGWLFSSGKAGAVEVEMGVGPTHMDGFDLLTVLVVAALILGFLGSIVYAHANWKEDEAA